MRKLSFLILCGISIGVCRATPSCHELQQSQLASLNERMTQMINSLYTSPIAAKAHLPSPPSSNATPSDCPYEAAYYQYPYTPPQVIYVPYPSPANNPPAYYPEYPESGMKPAWSNYYEQPYAVSPPAFPYPSPPQAPVANFPPPPTPYPAPSPYPAASPYPPIPYPPTPYPTASSASYPPSPYPPTPSATYPPVPTYPYSWDSYPEYPKALPTPQSYPPIAPYSRQPEIPPMPYYA